MTDASDGTVVLVHGAWHGSWAFKEVIRELEARDVRTLTVDLKSVGDDPAALGNLDDDVETVQGALDGVSGPVVLCGHSYGGIVITGAAADQPSVKHLVYLCAWMPDVGESLLSIIAGLDLPPWIVNRGDGSLAVDPDMATETFYADCDPQVAADAMARLRLQSAASFAGETRAAGWKEHPSTYILCNQDESIPPDLQRTMSRHASKVVEFDSSHSPFLSRPKDVADQLLLAGADGEARQW